MLSRPLGLRAVRARSSRPRWVAQAIYLTPWTSILAACAVTWVLVARLFI